MAYRVTLIPGDGIGPEVSGAAQRVIDATGVPIEWEVREAGMTALESQGELKIRYAHGMSEGERQRGRYRLDEGITGKVVSSGKPVVVPQVSKEPLFLNRTRRRDPGPPLLKDSKFPSKRPAATGFPYPARDPPSPAPGTAVFPCPLARFRYNGPRRQKWSNSQNAP